jgi:tRNA(fMet)-specific endonuclease VapC
VNYLLDSNIVSYILKKNAIVDNKLREVNIQGGMVFISCITYYEIRYRLLLSTNYQTTLTKSEAVIF